MSIFGTIVLFVLNNIWVCRTPNQEKRLSFGNNIQYFVVKGVDGVLRFAVDVFEKFEDGQTVRENDVISIAANEVVKS